MPTNSQITTVVIVDDHLLARSGVKQFLKGDRRIRITGEAGSYDEAVARIAELQPDVAIVDMRLGDHTGFDVLKSTKDMSPNTKILILTAYDEPRYVRSSLKLGAKGYLMKTVSPEELRRAVHDVAIGHIVISASVVANLPSPAQDYESPKTHPSDSENGNLSRREFEVLRLVGVGLKNAEIANALGISKKTVEAHLKNVFQKLGVGGRLEAVLAAIQRGWLGEERPESQTETSHTSLLTHFKSSVL
jgi:DNA-binding NarL/FixJ family response regulator